MKELAFSEKYKIKINDFDLKQTLECGQCFRYKRLEQNSYILIAQNRVLKIEQDQNQFTFYTTKQDFHEIWEEYFDLKKDYKAIKNSLAIKDKYLKKAVEEKGGIRIIKQDPWETLISFILSQTKQIPHIMALVEALSNAYGDYLGSFRGNDYYSFPDYKRLKDVHEEAYRGLKTGFRAAYIHDAVKRANENLLDLEALRKEDTSYIRQELKKIKGVGDKIADCVLLFAYSRTEVFPTDVWIKRLMAHFYGIEEKDTAHISRFAEEYFGELGGYAQQYLFYYGRDNKLGK